MITKIERHTHCEFGRRTDEYEITFMNISDKEKRILRGLIEAEK
jgi:hypothetical protein